MPLIANKKPIWFIDQNGDATPRTSSVFIMKKLNQVINTTSTNMDESSLPESCTLNQSRGGD
jgi:hypothetical protein